MKPQTYIMLLRSTQRITAVLLAVAALGIWTNFGILRLGITIGLLGLGFLFVLMGYPGPGIVTLTAGLLFNPSIPLSLPRNIWVILDLVSFVGIVFYTHQITDPYKKGVRFEEYVSTLFPEPEFIVENQTKDVSKFLGRRVESDSNPDFIFRNQKTGKRFAVECKWRGRWAKDFNGDPGIIWDIHRGNRYIEYGKTTGLPVYVALGIGGSPRKPKETYFLEAEKLQYPFLKQAFVRNGLNQL